MGEEQRTTRKFIPPAMPVVPADASTYTPPKYRPIKARSLTKTLVVFGICAAVVILAVVLFVHLMTTENMRETAAIQQQVAQQNAKDALTGGWYGTLDLPDQHATITIFTLPDDGDQAVAFASAIREPASIAVMLIDNHASAKPLIVDTTHTMLQCADGSSVGALDPRKIFSSSRITEGGAGLAMILPPYEIFAHLAPTTEHLFLPKGMNSRALSAITVLVNGEEKQITGQFSESRRTGLLHPSTQKHPGA